MATSINSLPYMGFQTFLDEFGDMVHSDVNMPTDSVDDIDNDPELDDLINDFMYGISDDLNNVDHFNFK